jgi:methyltransferase family protein
LSLGTSLRRLLGARLARVAGRCYRAIFVDLRKVAEVLAAAIPRNARVLDIGGGDGEPLNHLLALRSDLHITTLDPLAEVGQWIDARYSGRVTRLAHTSLAEYLAGNRADPDTLLIADVMHHIPPDARAEFLRSVRVLLDRLPRLRIIVKDVEPGQWRAQLGYWSDRYITGDREVSPISREDLVRLFEDYLGPLRRENTNLLATDEPNYAIVFFR